MERDLTPKITYPNPFGDGSTGSPLPEQSYIGDPTPTPASPPTWVPGVVVPVPGRLGTPVGAPVEREDYAEELRGLTAVLDRIADEMVKLREQLTKLAARKRRRK